MGKFVKRILIILIFLFISACNMPASNPVKTVKETLHIGSTLELTKTIVFPAEHLYIYIKNGELKKFKNYNTVNIYEPYCTIHLDREREQVYQVLPDQFKVTKFMELERDYGSILNEKQKIAHRDRFIKMSTGNNTGPSIVMYATIIHLHSTKQPDVKKLVCGHWNDSWEIEPLTLQEIRTALGKLIIIK